MQKVYFFSLICARQKKPFQSPKIVVYKNALIKPDTKHVSMSLPYS